MVAGQDSVVIEAKRGHLRELGIPTVFGAVVLFVSATLLLGVNIQALRDNLKWMEHSQKVLMQIADMETGILGDELMVRGYALTGDKRFLGFQQLERRKSLLAANQLSQLTAVMPDDAAQFRRVRRDFDRHMQIFGALSGMGPDQAGIVARAILDREIRANMKRTRTGLAALRAAEVKELGGRQTEMTAQISRAFFLAFGIIIAAFVLGGIGLMASQLHISLRR